MKSTEQALSEALNAGVTGALGALQFQVIALTAERDVLKSENAALKATYSYTVPPELPQPPLAEPAPATSAVRPDSPWLDRIEAVAASEGVAP